MIKVLFVESGFTGGGSFESLYQHLRVIDRNRIRPFVACLNENHYIGRIEELDIPVFLLTDRLHSRNAPRYTRKVAIKAKGLGFRANRVSPWLYPNILRWIHRPLVNALVDIIRNQAIDILHLNVQIYRDFFGLFVAERTGVACVSHLRSGDPRRRGEFNNRMAALANRHISAFVANSGTTADYWFEHGIDPNKTSIIHNGVPDDGIPPVDVRKTWNIESTASPVIGCVAPLRNRLKVDEQLVRGFASLLKNRPDAVLLVVGEGPMREVLEREADILGIKRSVIFTGFQKNVMGILAGVDVVVEASVLDSFSRVALETMRAGTPLLANDVGGIRELIRDGENGLLVRYGDPAAFAAAIKRVLAEDGLRARLVENGRRTIEERFTVERYASRIEEIYTGLVDGIESFGSMDWGRVRT